MSLTEELLAIEHRAQSFATKMHQDQDKKHRIVEDRLSARRRSLEQERSEQISHMRQKIAHELDQELTRLHSLHDQELRLIQDSFDLEAQADLVFEQVIKKTFDIAQLDTVSACSQVLWQ